MSAAPHSTRSTRNLRRRAARILVRLEEEYCTPDLGNVPEPLSELVFIVLSQMTTGPSYTRVFDRLRENMPDWERMAEISLEEFRGLIADAGLSGQKASRLKSIAARLKADFGEVTLEPLRRYDDAAAEEYLTSLPGVGAKTAKCVMMFSLNRLVLPVDTHVRRVMTRLALIPSGLKPPELHTVAELAVAPPLRRSFHVNALVHGQRKCRAKRARSVCPVAFGGRAHQRDQFSGGSPAKRASQLVQHHLAGANRSLRVA